MVAHTNNPNYSRGGDWEDHCLWGLQTEFPTSLLQRKRSPSKVGFNSGCLRNVTCNLDTRCLVWKKTFLGILVMNRGIYSFLKFINCKRYIIMGAWLCHQSVKINSATVILWFLISNLTIWTLLQVKKVSGHLCPYKSAFQDSDLD
jgi:hypothetical protein